MRLTDHSFVEASARFPLHTIDPVEYDVDAVWAEEEALSRPSDAWDAQSERVFREEPETPADMLHGFINATWGAGSLGRRA